MMLDIDALISHSKLGSFADDTRVWHATRLREEQRQLQEDLDTLYQWAEDNNFLFNEKKFEHLSYGKPDETFGYDTPQGKQIQGKETVRDLGVYFSSTGSFKEHILKVVADGKKLSGFILRTFRTRDRVAMLTLLKSLLVSKLEYACVVWSPTDKTLVRLLENVQRQFTSRFSYFNIPF